MKFLIIFLFVVLGCSTFPGQRTIASTSDVSFKDQKACRHDSDCVAIVFPCAVGVVNKKYRNEMFAELEMIDQQMFCEETVWSEVDQTTSCNRGRCGWH